eukprot:6728678-Lingulodinium_polyedra.AAC.1
MWECKLVGIIVRDGENTPLVVDQLVFLPITIEPVDGGYALHQHEYVKKACEQSGGQDQAKPSRNRGGQ